MSCPGDATFSHLSPPHHGLCARVLAPLAGAVLVVSTSGCCDGCDGVEQGARGDERQSRVVWSERVENASHRGPIRAKVTSDSQVVIAATLHGDVKIGGQKLDAKRGEGVVPSSSAAGDVVVWKLSAKGKPMWAQRFGDGHAQGVSSLAVTSAGTTFVGGTFEGSMPWGNHHWTADKGYAGFVGSLGPSGIPGWGTWFDATAVELKHASEPPRFGAKVRSIGTDARGRLFVMGTYLGKFRINGKQPIADQPDRVGGTFFARFDLGGALRWFKLASHPEQAGPGRTKSGTEALHAKGDVMFTTEHGNLVLMGTATGKGDFVSVPMQADPAGSVFVSVWNQSGQHLWTELFPASDELLHPRVTVAEDGSIYLAGVTRGTVTMGSSSVKAEPASKNPDGADALGELFVARLKPNGEPVWLKRITSVLWASPIGLSVDGPNGFVVAASTTLAGGRCDVGGGPLFEKEPPGTQDVVFAAGYGADGKHRWSRGFTAERTNHSGDVCVGKSGRTVLAAILNAGSCEPSCAQSALGDVFVAAMGK